MRSFGAEETMITREVRMPAALPFVFTGAKVAAALAVLGAVFGEWVGAQAGLGYLLLLEQRALDTDEVFAIIAVLSLLGIGFVALVSWLERLIIPWHRQAQRP
jgi:ABC-type nitrate/sulfonate/bicarbonate transport system permease component